MVNRTELAIYKATTDFKLEKHIDIIQLSISYSRSFASNKGKMTVNLENAIKAWCIKDFKQFNDILMMSDNAFDSAYFVHEYILACIKGLQAEKAEMSGNGYITERKKIDDMINRLNKFNGILSDSYGIESIEIESAPKYTKCDVYSMQTDKEKNRIIKLYNGYSFVLNGYTFSVYQDEYKRKIVLVPSTGIKLTEFKGAYKNAHEYIANLVCQLEKAENQAKLKEIETMFSATMSACGFENPYKSIVKEAEPTANIKQSETAENTAKIEKIKTKKVTRTADKRYIKRFNTIYKNRISCGRSFNDSFKNDYIRISGKAEKHYNISVLLAFNNAVLLTSNSSVYSALDFSNLNINRGSPLET